MSDAICSAAKKNCYAVLWSYGEICVGSNCCGQFGKGLKMWEARLKYHQQFLKEDMNFDRWHPDTIEIQKKNVRENIKWQKRKIRNCKKMIKYFKSKIHE